MIELWILVFGVFVALDVIWTNYIKAVARGLRVWAAFWSGLTVAVGGLGVIAYTSDPWLLVPAIAGGALGTFIAVEKQ